MCVRNRYSADHKTANLGLDCRRLANLCHCPLLLSAVCFARSTLSLLHTPRYAHVCRSAGVLLPKSELEAAAAACAAAGAWLVLDNTYEDFVYGGRSHHCLSGPNIINIFSFSKAYGMMG